MPRCSKHFWRVTTCNQLFSFTRLSCCIWPNLARSKSCRQQIPSNTTAFQNSDFCKRVSYTSPRCVLLDLSTLDIVGSELACALRHRFKYDLILVALTGSNESDAHVRDTFAVLGHCFQMPLQTKARRKILPLLRTVA